MRFRDRFEAGRLLAERLAAYRDHADVLVLALPRGGVPVAYEIARSLHAPLDVLLVRKLGVPGHDELAMGAIASGGTMVVNEDVIQALKITPACLEEAAARERAELERRETLYRGDRPPLNVRGRVVIIVDDGLATGATMRAAVRALRQLEPHRIIVAVPVGAAETCQELRSIADEVVAILEPSDFRAVGLWYHHFDQTPDDAVSDLLGRANRNTAADDPDPARRNDATLPQFSGPSTDLE